MKGTCKNCKWFEQQSETKCGLLAESFQLEEKTSATQDTPIARGRPDIEPEDSCDDWQCQSE